VQALARAVILLTAWAFFASGLEARAQTPDQDKDVQTSSSTTTKPKNIATSSLTADASTTGPDLFGVDGQATKTIDLKDLESEELWIAYATENEVKALIGKLVEHTNREHLELAEIVVAKIHRLQSALGLKNIPILTMSLARDARVLYSREKPLLAFRFLDSAARISPDLSQIHLLRLKLAFKHKPLGVKRWSRILLDYGMSRMTGFRNQSSLAFDVTLVFLLSIMAAVLLFTLVQGAKYLRYILFFVAQYSPAWLSQLHVALLLLLLLCAPFALGIGWILPVGVLLTLLWPFQREEERRIGIFCWTCLVAAPIALVGLGAFLAEKRSIDEDILSVLRDANSDASLQRVARYADGKEGSQDENAIAALAQSAWYRGDLDEAKSRYRQGLLLNPTDARTLNNLGRVLFFRREISAAKNRFSEAMRQATFAEPMLNHASLLLDEGRFEEAQKAIRDAAKIDPKRVRAYGSLAASISTADKLLMIPHSDAFAWSKMWSREPGHLWEIGFQIFRESGNPQNPLIISVILIVMGFFGVIVSRRRTQIGICIPCVKCGRPTRWNASDSHCDQCQSVFLRSVGVDPNKRRIKKQRVHSYQGRLLLVERIMSGIPGLSEVFSDRALIGFLRLFVFLCMISGLLIASFVEFGTTSIGLQTNGFARVCFGLIGFVMILLSVKRAFRS
jgi:tetratricopeptide (TPR) repeat protein